MSISLFRWEVEESEVKALQQLQPGDFVKVLYQGEESESNWAEIVRHHNDGFVVKPDPCIFFKVPRKMNISYGNVKEVYLAANP